MTCPMPWLRLHKRGGGSYVSHFLEIEKPKRNNGMRQGQFERLKFSGLVVSLFFCFPFEMTTTSAFWLKRCRDVVGNGEKKTIHTPSVSNTFYNDGHIQIIIIPSLHSRPLPAKCHGRGGHVNSFLLLFFVCFFSKQKFRQSGDISFEIQDE